MTPPYYPQETDLSCAIACFRMVLAAYGIMKSETELRVLCDCTIFGTSALELIQAGLPYRSADFGDWIADVALGSFLGAVEMNLPVRASRTTSI